MDSTHFDCLIKMFGTRSTRRTALGLLSALGLGDVLAVDAAAKKKRKKCKSCGPCRTCKRGKCKPKPNGSGCGGGASCQGGVCVCPTECCADADCAACETCVDGQCVSGCPDGQTCDGDACVCPAGQKECEGDCIAESECCGACPQGQTCCGNVGQCKDLRNDSGFCGQCANGQCPGGAFCANGACGLTCNVIGQVCLAPDCLCGSRVDAQHNGQKVCAGISPFDCNTVTTCSTDADCSPGTQGFRQVCVSGLCAGKSVCADPCA